MTDFFSVIHMALCLPELTQKATEGDAEAQFNLGIMYYEGGAVRQDFRLAADWFRKAAEQGHADAQYNLGVMYVEGRGVPQDFRKAVDWYARAAEQGLAHAQ
jgi:TPR repeat protein